MLQQKQNINVKIVAIFGLQDLITLKIDKNIVVQNVKNSITKKNKLKIIHEFVFLYKFQKCSTFVSKLLS